MATTRLSLLRKRNEMNTTSVVTAACCGFHLVTMRCVDAGAPAPKRKTRKERLALKKQQKRTARDRGDSDEEAGDGAGFAVDLNDPRFEVRNLPSPTGAQHPRPPRGPARAPVLPCAVVRSTVLGSTLVGFGVTEPSDLLSKGSTLGILLC